MNRAAGLKPSAGDKPLPYSAVRLRGPRPLPWGIAGKSILLCSLGITLLSGCNPQDAANLKRDTSQLARTTGETLGNASLHAKVSSVLSVWKGVDMSGLHIDAKDGVVTLGGHVRTKAEKAKIENVARQIRGVDKVISNLRVEP